MASGILGLIRLLIPAPGSRSEEIVEKRKHKRLFAQFQLQFAVNRPADCWMLPIARENRVYAPVIVPFLFI